MKLKAIFASACVAAVGIAPGAPSVSGVGARVEAGARRLVVDYTLSEPAIVTFDVTTNGVTIGGRLLRKVVGDVAHKVSAGARSLVWNWPDEFDGVAFSAGAATARVAAWPTNAPPDYMVVDLKTDLSWPVAYQGDGPAFYLGEDYLPHGIESDLYRTDYMVLRRIPAKGVTWKMGTPSTESGHCDGEEEHPVTFTHDYYMAVFPLTVGQFNNILYNALPPSLWSAANYPNRFSEDLLVPNTGYLNLSIIYGGSYGAAGPTASRMAGGNSQYYNLSRMCGFVASIPSDAEWEYAARAGEKAAHYDGTDDASTLGDLGWFDANAGGKLHRVGEKKPNKWGLYDLYGNVCESCIDLYTTNLCNKAQSYAEMTPAVDPLGPTEADRTPAGAVQYNRVVRGGSIQSGANDLRSGRRIPKWYNGNDGGGQPMNLIGSRPVLTDVGL